MKCYTCLHPSIKVQGFLFTVGSYLLCFLFCLLAQSGLFAQAIYPGGVHTPKLWYAAESTADGEIIWKDILSGEVISRQKENAESWLNFNPAFTFDREFPGLNLPATVIQPEKWTLFTTYQPRDTFNEQSIWSFSRAGITEGILTTHRMADLRQFEYLNFSHPQHNYPRVSTYLHHRGKEAGTSQSEISFQLARKPHDRQLPVNSFTGKMPEIILYERVLSPEERQRVASYLSIKYGTHLAPEQELDYLNASGQVLLSPANSDDFRYRVTGIGRDDLSGLYQRQSTSSYAPGLLTVGLDEITDQNTSGIRILPDQNFLLWADNNAPLEPAEKQVLQPTTLLRQWQAQVTGNWSDQSVALAFDTHQLRTPAGPEETYWLVVDRSARGNFGGIASVDYYPLYRLWADGRAHFRDIRWDTDGSGQDVFTLATGPELFVQAEMDAPNCFPAENGNLRLKAVGGRAPYQFQLRRNDQLVVEWTGQTAEILEIPDLPADAYELLLSDADGKHYRETFYFQSADAPEISLAGVYQLPADQPLFLDASLASTTDLTYTWQLPDGTTHHSPQISITQAGEYILLIDRNACISRQRFRVEPAPRGNFRRVELFPNPSSDGHFRARVHLEHSAELHWSVFSPDGRLLLQREHRGGDYYHTGAQLSGKGTYLIRFSSQNDQLTIPFIVQ
ncbi:T9SS type A sorting domain-containing protein [Flavilitoribacter nigricans]|uniref:DUF8202 domain-containing protein n=1 Tax=Flavilitoribacter nigricans (strain ATCC 23147 / DSM 23189 / NBRC 102662 / NCIMB 1420 / SS-2) TaxID=1122177 RepID=A0A2D0NID7_FLAN2|nr:T9SS type A sorting domain-containing protein [Flavilitoribacter nigricans]PHN08262.1 hypothetical protein CRP01_02770 [Flavilitoribacter nigricans DSM 23189 = NBRC 102662]